MGGGAYAFHSAAELTPNSMIRSLKCSRPIFGTVLLAGVAVAVALVDAPDPFGFIGFGSIKTLVVVLWFTLTVQAPTLLLNWMAQEPRRFHIVQPITLPLFEIATKFS